MKREIAELEAQMGKTTGPDPKGASAPWIDIASMGPTQQLAVCAGSVLGLYLVFGLCQEYLIKVKYGDSMGWYMTLTQFSYYSSFAFAQRKWTSKGEGPWARSVPMSYYVILGGLQAACMGLSNVSVQYLSYPTHILFKSSKPVPALLYGAGFLRKRYLSVDWLAVVLMVTALRLVVSADMENEARLDRLEDNEDNFTAVAVQQSSVLGIVLVSAALMAEVVIGSVQERVSSRFNAQLDELVFYTYFVGSFFVGIVCLVTGELWDGILVTFDEPHMVLAFICLSATGYYGVTALKLLVKYSGAFAALVTTTGRKCLALVLSVLVFPKMWTLEQSAAALLFIVGYLLSSSASKLKLRGWLGDSAIARILQLDTKRSRALRAVR
eukprot:Tamp_18730.p1 GENE.Tamp_18730~~Tamp_18730.p1  ORF type:complete len:420 (-),score=73.69 Tamp_18730:43-1188(-)